MKIAHLTPTFFHPKSVVGGGDRYPLEVAAAQRRAGYDAQVFTFGPNDEELDYKGAPVHVRRIRRLVSGNVVDPLGDAPRLAARFGDVLHAYQEHTMSTNAGVILARARRRAAFVTDLGGTGRAPSRYVPLAPLLSGYLPISEYAGRVHARWASKTRNIGAGVDVARHDPAAAPTRGYVLFVGRLMSHKGIDYLIEGMPHTVPLVVVGEPYQPEYAALLRQLAAGRDVTFRTGVSDEELAVLYQNALVTVLPTVTRDRWGRVNDRAQLSALTVMESFAAGTPALATRVEALPEIVREGETGFLVSPNDPAALGDAIGRLAADPALVARMGRAGREYAERHCTWDAVARRSIAAYAELSTRRVARRIRAA